MLFCHHLINFLLKAVYLDTQFLFLKQFSLPIAILFRLKEPKSIQVFHHQLLEAILFHLIASSI
jgi:hypothetical protein